MSLLVILTLCETILSEQNYKRDRTGDRVMRLVKLILKPRSVSCHLGRNDCRPKSTPK